MIPPLEDLDPYDLDELQTSRLIRAYMELRTTAPPKPLDNELSLRRWKRRMLLLKEKQNRVHNLNRHAAGIHRDLSGTPGRRSQGRQARAGRQRRQHSHQPDLAGANA